MLVDYKQLNYFNLLFFFPLFITIRLMCIYKKVEKVFRLKKGLNNCVLVFSKLFTLFFHNAN
jgi:hypothetical protein